MTAGGAAGVPRQQAARHARGTRWRRVAGGALVLLALLSAAAVALLADPPWLRTLRHVVFDQYQRWQPRPWQDTAVRVVDVDEESLARIGQWPWPRSRIAEMVARAQAAQAAAVGLDMIFGEPDRTAPRAMARAWNLPANQAAALAVLPDPDEVFATALRQGGTVLGFAVLPHGAGAPPAAGVTLPETARYVLLGDAPVAAVPSFAQVVPALPLLAGAASGNGALAFLPDGDGVVRRVPLVLRVGDRLLPSLSVEMLRVAQGESNYLLRASAAGRGLAELRTGRLALPTTASGEFWVHYSGPAPRRTLPAWKLLQGEVPASELQGRLLLVGSSAQGLQDLRFTPQGRVAPGVEVHAQVLEQALTGRWLQRPAWTDAVEALALVGGGLLAGVLALSTGPLLSAAAALLVVGALGAAGWLAFSTQGLLLDPLTPALGVLVAFLGASVVRHQASERRRRWVARAFSRYVSPNLVAHLVRHPDQLELGGRRQACSFVFTDLAGFTAMMERTDPVAAVGVLNTYFDGMIAIAFRHEGTLDRIVGDALAVMFSAPVPQADHRERAVACALEMQVFAHGFAERHAALGFGATRIGVHSGEVIVGNVGGGSMFDYRALGDAVNTAARLESANKHLGTCVCISEAALAPGWTPPVRLRPVGRLVLKGKTHPLQVFQPLRDGLPAQPQDAGALAAYAAAYALMAQQQPEALAAFEALAAQDAADRLVALHLARLRRGETGDLVVLGEK